MSFRNVVPIVVAVVAGISITNYTLKPELERQQKLREQSQQLPKTFSSGEPKTSELQTSNQTTSQAGAGTENWRPKS
ncbi:hypothetical protein CORC01_08521 [Colletotrichum orchidophilum]|uniref:Uncharacterized protein n=1 Tax=Colletotrichum orchidophilum TaxID=1209926 RepID=A0A1G4B421_9PEZI|nr:uncharacterized protein CORC01_08521 [Colletotrichum orchidophilum]OHE96144.1 hypothetical protein CORC01_08521 [Colletotrichum orchidophilum]